MEGAPRERLLVPHSETVQPSGVSRIACERCRRLHKKCMGGHPCKRCTRAGMRCVMDINGRLLEAVSDPRPPASARVAGVHAVDRVVRSSTESAVAAAVEAAGEAAKAAVESEKRVRMLEAQVKALHHQMGTLVRAVTAGRDTPLPALTDGSGGAAGADAAGPADAADRPFRVVGTADGAAVIEGKRVSGVVVVDHHHQLTYISPELARELFGRTQGELVGMSMLGVVCARGINTDEFLACKQFTVSAKGFTVQHPPNCESIKWVRHSAGHMVGFHVRFRGNLDFQRGFTHSMELKDSPLYTLPANTPGWLKMVPTAMGPLVHAVFRQVRQDNPETAHTTVTIKGDEFLALAKRFSDPNVRYLVEGSPQVLADTPCFCAQLKVFTDLSTSLHGRHIGTGTRTSVAVPDGEPSPPPRPQESSADPEACCGIPVARCRGARAPPEPSAAPVATAHVPAADLHASPAVSIGEDLNLAWLEPPLPIAPGEWAQGMFEQTAF